MADFSDSVFVEDLIRGHWQPLGGTHSWRAPECYKSITDIYDPLRTDIYSFGLCALAVLAPAEGQVPGSPDDCFLDRLFAERGRASTIKNLKLGTNHRVIDLARSWADNAIQNSSIKELSQQLSVACLCSLPGRRLDISSIVSIINRSEARPLGAWTAREWSRHFTAVNHIDQLEDLILKDLATGTSSSDKNFLFVPSNGLMSLSSPVQKHIVQQLEMVATRFSDDFIPPVDESFLDGDFTLDEVRSSFLDSMKLVPPSTMGDGEIDRIRRIFGTLSLCYHSHIQETSKKDDTAVARVVAQRLARAGRVGVHTAITLYLNLSGSLGSAEMDASFVPRKLWMIYGYINGNWAAKDLLQSQYPELYSKAARLLTLRQCSFLDDSNPMDDLKRFLEEATSSGFDIEEFSTPGGRHLLDLAILTGDMSMVRYVVDDLRFDIDLSSGRIGMKATVMHDNHVTPTMNAAYLCHLEVLHFLLSKQPNLTSVTEFGVSILHCIAWFPDDVAASLVPDLVAHGALLDTIAKSPQNTLSRPGMPKGTPLCWAVRLGKKCLAQALVAFHRQKGVEMKDANSALKRAARHLDVDSCALLLDNCEILQPNNTQPSTQLLDDLLLCSVSLNPIEYKSLVKHGLSGSRLQSQMVKFLLDRGAGLARQPGIQDLNAPPNSRPDWGLIWAINNGCTAAFQILIEDLRSEGYDIGEILQTETSFSGFGAIAFSIMHNQQSIFDYLMTLVDSGHLDINKPYAVGRTVLHAAASQTNNTHYIGVLMKYGLEPDALDDGFQTPLGQAVTLRYFEGAKIMLSDPRYDKARIFETPHRIGYFLFEYHVFGSLRAVWPELVISQIEFYESVGATEAAMTRPNVLRCLSDDWPSIREEVRGFNSWFLDWTLERMQADQINYQDEEGGFAVLHLMGYHANFDGIAAMLQCDKVDRYVLTRKKMSVFDCIFMEDGTRFPDRLIKGGARELQAFRSRLSRVAELLLTTNIPLWCSEGLSRRGEVDKRFKALDQQIKIALGKMRRTTETDSKDNIFETAVWPQSIPAKECKEDI